MVKDRNVKPIRDLGVATVFRLLFLGNLGQVLVNALTGKVKYWEQDVRFRGTGLGAAKKRLKELAGDFSIATRLALPGRSWLSSLVGLPDGGMPLFPWSRCSS